MVAPLLVRRLDPERTTKNTSLKPLILQENKWRAKVGKVTKLGMAPKFPDGFTCPCETHSSLQDRTWLDSQYTAGKAAWLSEIRGLRKCHQFLFSISHKIASPAILSRTWILPHDPISGKHWKDFIFWKNLCCLLTWKDGLLWAHIHKILVSLEGQEIKDKPVFTIWKQMPLYHSLLFNSLSFLGTEVLASFAICSDVMGPRVSVAQVKF